MLAARVLERAMRVPFLTGGLLTQIEEEGEVPRFAELDGGLSQA